MKKIIMLILICTLVLSFTACEKASEEPETQKTGLAYDNLLEALGKTKDDVKSITRGVSENEVDRDEFLSDLENMIVAKYSYDTPAYNVVGAINDITYDLNYFDGTKDRVMLNHLNFAVSKKGLFFVLAVDKEKFQDFSKKFNTERLPHYEDFDDGKTS